MNYSIEIGKIIEGAIKGDSVKIQNYTKLLIDKLLVDGEEKTAQKFSKLLAGVERNTLSPSGLSSFSNTIPVDNESRIALADILLPAENMNTAILSEKNQKELEEFVLNYKTADKLNELGIGVSNTLLLYGPPGCGKTKSAQWIAKQLGLPLITARLDSLISSYLGTTAKNIRVLFEYAQRMPCVLLLDEFDAIAKARDDANELGELKRIVNSLLQNIDAMSKDSLLIAATNHSDLLDRAVWRRFDYKIEVEYPDVQNISRLLDLFINKKFDLSIKNKELLSYAFQGCSGATIEEIVKKSIRECVVNNKDFSVRNVYAELFAFKGFPDEQTNKKAYQKEVINYLYKEIGKPFSYDTISEILNISKSQIKPLMNCDGGSENE